MKSRTKARSLALQILYEVDQSGHLLGDVIQSRLIDNDYYKEFYSPDDDPSSLDASLVDFAIRIVQGIVPLVSKLDQLISQHAPEWPLDQVAVIDRNIIRIALWEFAIEKCTPTKVAINEAIELAKLFGSESTPRFVNGVLGSLAEQQNEISQAFGGQTST